MGTHADVSRRADRRSYQAVMESSDANLVQLLDRASDAIVIHRENQIVYVNPAALELFGYEATDVLGRSPFDFVSPRQHLLVAERVLTTYVKRAVAAPIEERLLGAKGREVPLEVTAIPMVFGTQIATLVHMRDISAPKPAENAMEEAREALELCAPHLRDGTSQADVESIRALVAKAEEALARGLSRRRSSRG